MKFIFLVQGEGRGHMSQAITLQEKLKTSGHTVAAVFIGAKNLNSIPLFFKEQFNCPLFTLNSPKFSTDKEKKGILIFKSFLISLKEIPSYIKSVKKVSKTVNNLKPDALISFYEPILGIYLRLFNKKIANFFIGHQYFLNHSKFDNLFINLFEKAIFRIYNNICSPKQSIKLALSFTKEEDELENNLYICPPLIKFGIKNSKPSNNNYILSYTLNPGYSKDLIIQAKNNNKINIETFTKSKILPKHPNNIKIHPLSNELFIDKLINCKYYISTAGFDSICEAAFLQKQIRLVPTKGHIEQKYNAIDANRAGIAIRANDFNIEHFLTSKADTNKLCSFKEWVNGFDNKILNIIEENINLK